VDLSPSGHPMDTLLEVSGLWGALSGLAARLSSVLSAGSRSSGVAEEAPARTPGRETEPAP
jgi:hypothetical protein